MILKTFNTARPTIKTYLFTTISQFSESIKSCETWLHGSLNYRTCIIKQGIYISTPYILHYLKRYNNVPPSVIWLKETYSFVEVEDGCLDLGLLFWCLCCVELCLVVLSCALVDEGPNVVYVDGGHVVVTRAHVVVTHTDLGRRRGGGVSGGKKRGEWKVGLVVGRGGWC